MASVKDPRDTSGRLIAASKVNGTSVYSPSGEKLGSVYDVMLDKKSGKADYAIMSFGGFLGMGEKYHPLPWDQLQYSPDADGYVVNIDRNTLEGGPAYDSYDASTWGDDTWGQRVNDYYGRPAADTLDPTVPGVGMSPRL